MEGMCTYIRQQINESYFKILLKAPPLLNKNIKIPEYRSQYKLPCGN